MRILTFTSDFGISDSYVAQMKGAALSVNDALSIVDLCHEIPAHNIALGARIFAESVSTFPAECVHVAVVDPGVGTNRRRIIIESHVGDSYDKQSSFFVGPDNGLLLRAAPKHRIKRAWEIDKLEIFGRVSGTFEGRDVFAPAGAHIASGDDISTFASEIADLSTLIEAPRKSLRESADKILGEIDYIDGFGNAVSNIHLTDTEAPQDIKLSSQPGLKINRYLAYSEIPANTLGLILGSQDYFELACNGQSAAKNFSIKIGDELRVKK